jgi:16S rRNA (guanine527-N7)-methyltransferase
MDAAIKERLRRGAAALELALDKSQLAQLDRYLALLLTWNRKINLTAIIEPAEIVDRHFLDSLAVAPLVDRAATLVDVGSGAGFPGAVLAIARPTLHVTCVESIHKKVAFLQTLRLEIASNLEPVCARAEQLDRRFDVAISRATWDPPEWLAHGAPLVAPGGLLIAMQTADSPELAAPPGFTREPARDYRIGDRARRLQPFRHD